MEFIDVYYEWLLKQKQGSKVSVLPDGLTEEQSLWRMDVLIRDLFSQMTLYSAEDYRSGRATLILLKKFCFSNATYGNAPRDAAFRAYSEATVKMIDDELARVAASGKDELVCVNPEKLFTIITNTLQMLTSIVQYHGMKKEERTNRSKAKIGSVQLPIKINVQKEIVLERSDTKIVDVIPYLDSAFAISESFNASKKNANAPRKVAGEWAEFKYLTMILDLTMVKLDELGVL